MYVCLCNMVTDQDIKKFRENFPCDSFKECCEKLKIGSNCGICKMEAKNLLNEDKGPPQKK